MTEVAVWHPRDKFKLPHELGLKQDTVLHFLDRKPLTSALALTFGQIDERTFISFRSPEAPEQLLAQSGRKPLCVSPHTPAAARHSSRRWRVKGTWVPAYNRQLQTPALD